MLSSLLLELYRAAQGMAVDEFQAFTFGLLKSHIPFDSARYVGGVLTPQGMKAHDFSLYNKAPEIMGDYERIAHIDPVVGALKTNPGKMVRFNPPTLYAERSKRPLLDFARRHEHMNGMSGLFLGREGTKVEAFSVFRADPEDHFRKEEGTVLELLLPHCIEAFRLNRELAVNRIERDLDGSAIASATGALHYCSAGFRSLLSLDWPDWDNALLPQALQNELQKTGTHGYCSKNLRISATRIGELLFLKARSATPPGLRNTIHPEILQERFGLTQAETRVAIAMLDGKTAKEVAVCMKVSPHTVRVQAKAIYRKLGVNTRAAFVKTVLDSAQAFNA